MDKIMIQEDTLVSFMFIERVIKRIKDIKENVDVSIGEYTIAKEDAIEAVESMSELGKKILVEQYKFEHSPFYNGVRDEDETN